jgi:hypothetical protein
MSLASLLKKGSLRGFATATPATFATHNPYSPPTVATVATVAVAKAPDRAVNDPANTERDAPENLIKPDIAAAYIAPALDPDRWCWPHSEAMRGAEIDAFTARLHHFTLRGLVESDAEKLADKLVTRDRESDDRRLCLECVHLAGHAGTWGCRNWQRAGVANKSRDARLPAELVSTLQRCDGFNNQMQTGDQHG